MRHPAWSLSKGGKRRERSRDALHRIAETIGCSIEELTRQAEMRHYPDDAAELIRLWFKIKDEDARAAILRMARNAAGE